MLSHLFWRIENSLKRVIPENDGGFGFVATFEVSPDGNDDRSRVTSVLKRDLTTNVTTLPRRSQVIKRINSSD